MKTSRIIKALKNDRGYVFIEASIVYPMMFFIIVFLIYTGNMFLLKARIHSEVASEAIKYANYFANPYIERIEDKDFTVDTKISDAHVTDHMYRYLNVFTKNADGEITEDLKNRISQIGLFNDIRPEGIVINEHKVHNVVLYQTYVVDVEYDLKFPIKLIFFDHDWILQMSSREEAPITDQSEFIRNIDWAIDIWERWPEAAGEENEECERAKENMKVIEDKFGKDE